MAALAMPLNALAQEIHTYDDSVVVNRGSLHLKADLKTGKTNYTWGNGTSINNAIISADLVGTGRINSSDFPLHSYKLSELNDKLGKGALITINHTGGDKPCTLQQRIAVYNGRKELFIDTKVISTKGARLESRDISPIAVSPKQNGSFKVGGSAPRILDVPFDNDSWVNILTQAPPADANGTTAGISYEFASLYDYKSQKGFVLGSIKHDFWKTGIAYRFKGSTGEGDSLYVFGGVATADVPKLERSHGGQDGTHDHALHGTMVGSELSSPTIYLGCTGDMLADFKGFGKANEDQNGKLEWKGPPPFYWNSFGVEGVLGYEKVMFPPGVKQITDFIGGLKNFNAYGKPVLSIDSHDQNIYTVDKLAELGKYAESKGQQIGFYCSLFAQWSWANAIVNGKFAQTDYYLRDVVLTDKDHKPIFYKGEGDSFGAYALDPTHPAVRENIIAQLKKAKAIGAKFIKIDFLSAGSLESTTRYDTTVRTGMQAYDRGLKMFKTLADSIMGKDIFITMAISPTFPNQYAHARFISTDVYSHLRDDQKGFPSWGSTEASLASASHMGWAQGTLWPYTNMDVAIMKKFQKNPELNEQEIKVRLYAMMVMGSILGDGSDFRDKTAAVRAQKFLNNKYICDFFSKPEAFTPLKFADGETFDQQMDFYHEKKGLLAIFNFDTKQGYKTSFNRNTLHLKQGQRYELRDFMTNAVIKTIAANDEHFELQTNAADALMVKLVPVK
ncbi:hypothetical protein D0C36_03665 [Mucilaginibacter conchicola]|uniref:Alpha-galactosidase n=2 Tax=Mucilaginibacter conchicola TaxID=2303333 RepID=A0A372P0B0_9SPHI|nr:hypothetical protein D0C36_03665 [Mucilaginibacter conchicola]